jgi:MSHA pilin protein MshD
MPYKPSQLMTAVANKQQGFTLVELIVGIVTLAIAFSIITTLLVPTAQKSAEQILQIRAAELGQSLMNEISGKAFDENSDRVGGEIRCGEALITCTTSLGPDGETLDLYDDVDDYHGLDENGDTFGELYNGYTVSISVCNDSNYDGVCGELGVDDNVTAKLISITITDPVGNPINFATYRTNY